MATIIGRGYNPSGVSSSPSGNAVISDSPATLSYGNIASGLAKVAGADASLLGDLIRESSGISSRNSALSQAFAREQMDFQEESSRYAMNWSAEEAANNREWQERLSNTAHRREVADLMAAGLNPILSANHGAVTGSGATGQAFQSAGSMGSVDTTNPLNMLQGFFADILNSAMAMKMHTDQMNLEQSRINANERIAKTSADATMYAATKSAGAAAYSADQHRAGVQDQITANKILKEMDIAEQQRKQYSEQDWQSIEKQNDRDANWDMNERNHGRTLTGTARELGESIVGAVFGQDTRRGYVAERYYGR